MLLREGLYHIETKELSIAAEHELTIVDSVAIVVKRPSSMEMRLARIAAVDRM